MGTLIIPPGGGSAGGLVFLAAQTASNSATLDFTGLFSSAYENYLLRLSNIVPATAAGAGTTGRIILRVSTDGGSTFAAGASDYDWAGFRQSPAGNAGAGSTADSHICLDADGKVNNTASYGGINGSIVLFNPLGTSAYTIFGEGGFSYVDGPVTRVNSMGVGGSYKFTTAVNALRVMAFTGNLTSGNAYLYAFKKS